MRKNIAANDVAGNFSLTLIDVIDTLVVLNDRQGFEKAVKNIIEWVSFDVNTKPQVFETTIRVLGGLLSGHIFANQTGQPFHLPWYRGELLHMAHDLGIRLLPAFGTPTGLPYARINLRHGLTKGETLETCTAGAGSLILEFATLSRLTGDDRFEKAAHKAFFGLWNRKSDIGLVGNTINTHTGVRESSFIVQYSTLTSYLKAWISPEVTGIGAGVDSFYEYALKWYILSGDVEFLDVWEEAYTAIMRYSRAADGFWIIIYGGNIQDFPKSTTQTIRQPPLINTLCDLYLYLLFDEENPLHNDDSNYVFTTEGHILSLRPQHLRPMSAPRRKLRHIDNHQCPAYKPFIHVSDAHRKGSGLVQGIQYRPDFDYARSLVGLIPTQSDIDTWSPYGWCEKPHVDLFAYDVILTPNGKNVAEDLSPSLLKLGILSDGFVLQNVTGIRAHIVRRLDGKGYDIRKLGHYTVRTGHLVYINDTSLFAHLDIGQAKVKRSADILLRFYVDGLDPMFQVQTGMRVNTPDEVDLLVVGYTAHFGGDFTLKPLSKSLPLAHQDGVAVHKDLDNTRGCHPYKQAHPGKALVVHRGDCTFLEKLLHARAASAAGVIVISDDDLIINPTANPDEVEAAGDLSEVALVLLPKKAGEVLTDMMDQAELGVTMVVEDEEASEMAHIPPTKDPNRILYINGHPLLNTRLLV
ncbi:hypothetical protein H0H81_000301 [Sphagnurus paluster]|uniref:alpha-1,2-Mannosidase n=1 Tax=Sphagnurus paluster TaxID=117069 RepID=A0A9P7GNI2_9AGAR|nr:hypothetical protein H0H81_000301 [Sphagnurus paluster]